MINLNNKVIVISGASSGIGKATAIICSELGAKIALVSRSEEKLLQVREELLPNEHHVFSCDLSETSSVKDLVANIYNAMGVIDGLVYASGEEYTCPLKILDNDKLKEIYNLNVFSAIAMAKEITKRKYVGDNASLIFIASIVGILGEAGKIGYSSSKGALVAACKSMAMELAKRGIRVNSVLPALVKTPMSQKVLDTLDDASVSHIRDKHPLGFGEPEDVANSIAFLLSDKSSWITGTEFIIDGGFSAS